MTEKQVFKKTIKKTKKKSLTVTEKTTSIDSYPACVNQKLMKLLHETEVA